MDFTVLVGFGVNIQLKTPVPPMGGRLWKFLDCVVNIPHVSTQGVGSPLQGPGEKGQLPSETGLIKQAGVSAEQAQVLSESAQCVVAPPMQNVPERSLHC